MIVIELPEPYAKELQRIAKLKAHHLTSADERPFWEVINEAVGVGLQAADKPFWQCSLCTDDYYPTEWTPADGRIMNKNE